MDRAKDMIISGGENIYPAEVEAVLADHPSVAEVAVVGRPDPVWGEAVHAVIIPVAGAEASPEAIISWSRERLAHFKCPKTVEFAGSLPRTTTGKVLKRELRAQLAAATGSESAAAADEPATAGQPATAGSQPATAADKPATAGSEPATAADECTERRVIGRREVHS